MGSEKLIFATHDLFIYIVCSSRRMQNPISKGMFAVAFGITASVFPKSGVAVQFKSVERHAVKRALQGTATTLTMSLSRKGASMVYRSLVNCLQAPAIDK